MRYKKHSFNRRQLVFQELFIGTLIYAVVLGFFDDYSTIVEARSFSTIFLSAAVLEALTYLAFMLKSRIITRLKGRSGRIYQLATFFSVWFVMFSSKLVFVWALDLAFGDYIQVNGFFGILAVVATVTFIHKLAYIVFKKLGGSNASPPIET
jgi:hypothetical protein